MNSKFKTGFRIFFGVICVIFGFNPFLHFMPIPPMPGDAGILNEIYQNSGFMKFIHVFQILGGLGLIFGKYISLSLTFIVAIFFNATIFHVFHDMAGVGMAAFMFVLSLVLVFLYKDKFASLFEA